ncbi:hypothetical protein Tco_1064684 [Tanacetum coccineum]
MLCDTVIGLVIGLMIEWNGVVGVINQLWGGEGNFVGGGGPSVGGIGEHTLVNVKLIPIPCEFRGGLMVMRDEMWCWGDEWVFGMDLG